MVGQQAGLTAIGGDAEFTPAAVPTVIRERGTVLRLAGYRP
tara:strand:+ start:1088 stop:1210 length:123 start_codon:yes stop_codon:yes gene_type:complete